MVFQDFLIAVIKALVWVGFIGFFTIVIGRALWIRWSRRWQFAMKYNLLKSKVDPVKAEWCMEAIRRGLRYDQIKMMLLLRGFKDQDVHEMLFLCTQFSNNQVKGGNNGREQFKRSNKKDETGKLPNISSY